ncbi:hypothetical protein K9N68_33220 [Kovacikia minuta CCNUW1]|uniref:hypothetical protein n=1 Tax=Kovacikia minuta TaxID=2931930 RepID=UPI001CC91E9D|nr:hypothetical protein [Kovacikia minuta]UBF26308.1 hypothetical protein K9N68_33220 [Kovacikia minuta CCNUW1]
MKAPSKGSLLKGAVLAGILSLGMAGSLVPTAPAEAAPRWCRGRYVTQRVWVPNQLQRRWIPARWETYNGHRRYISGRWDEGRQNRGRYVVKRVWVSNCR